MTVLPSLGPHAAFIVIAYGAALLVVVLLIAWVWLDYQAQKRKLDELDGLVTVERIKARQGAFKPFQRQHTPGGNYARLGGSRFARESTLRPAVLCTAGLPCENGPKVRLALSRPCR